jgi:hypothetical protein
VKTAKLIINWRIQKGRLRKVLTEDIHGRMLPCNL